MKLMVLSGEMKGREFPLQAEIVNLGRREDNDVCIPTDGGVSRSHCRLRHSADGYLLEDQGSANGTWIGETRVQEPSPLAPRQVFRIGSTHLCLLHDEDHDPPSMEPVSTSGPAATQSFIPTDRHATGAQKERDTLQVAGVARPEDVWDLARKGGAGEVVRRRLQVFQDVSKALAGKLEIRDLLQAVLDSSARVVPAERAYIFLAGEGAESLTPIVSWPAEQPEGRPVNTSRTLLQRVLSEGVATLVMDTQSDVELNVKQSIKLAAIRSAMGVPLICDGEVRAVLHMDASEAQVFTQDDLELMTAIGNQAALALQTSELHEQLHRTQEQLMQTEKLSTIGTLAASIAHDVRNVLTPISMVAGRVLKMEGIDPRMKEVFERQIQRLRALSQQLLSFSRGDATLLEPVDVNQGIAESLELVKTEARHLNSEITAELAEDLPKIDGDLNRLDQVFVNLMINAVQAMEAQGGGTILVKSAREGNDVLISFADTGPGIPPDTLRRIFQPFFTTKGAKGNGLGLFSCKRIVEEEHRGHLEVDSVVGEGTTFLIRIPVSRST